MRHKGEKKEEHCEKMTGRKMAEEKKSEVERQEEKMDSH